MTQGEVSEDDKKDIYDHESNHQARVAQSLQAHDYVSFSLESVSELTIGCLVSAVSENWKKKYPEHKDIQFTARRLQKPENVRHIREAKTKYVSHLIS